MGGPAPVFDPERPAASAQQPTQIARCVCVGGGGAPTSSATILRTYRRRPRSVAARPVPDAALQVDAAPLPTPRVSCVYTPLNAWPAQNSEAVKSPVAGRSSRPSAKMQRQHEPTTACKRARAQLADDMAEAKAATARFLAGGSSSATSPPRQSAKAQPAGMLGNRAVQIPSP